MKWFQHLTRSGDDPDIGEITTVFGFKGYYMFFRTLEIMADEFNVENPGENSFDFRWFLERFSRKIDKKTLLKFLDLTKKQERISYKIENNVIHLNCHKLKDLADDYTRKRIAGKLEINPEKIQKKSDMSTVHKDKDKSKDKNKDKKEDIYKETRHEVVRYLNEKTGKDFDLDSNEAIKYINGRLSDKKKPATLEELKKVIDIKCSQWLKNKEFNKNLRPSTLFRPSNFENYRNELPMKDIGRIGNGKTKGKYDDCIDEEV